MAKFFNGLGTTIIIAGIIIGFYLGRQVQEISRLFGEESGFNWNVAFTAWIYSAISGLLFIAFAKCYERIEDLEVRVKDISVTVENTYRLLNKQQTESNPNTTTPPGNKKKEFNLQDFISKNSTPPV